MYYAVQQLQVGSSLRREEQYVRTYQVRGEARTPTEARVRTEKSEGRTFDPSNTLRTM
jgi:hypothetical protein